MAKKKEPIVTLGLTRRQFDEIKQRKLSDDLEKIAGNCAGEMKDKLFNKDFENYELPMHERFHYHVAMELRLFDTMSGQRLSKAMVQKFEKNSWEAMRNSDVFKTYTSEFVHNPALEKKDAPLVTLLYTLTEEEIAIKEREEAEQYKLDQKAAAEALASAPSPKSETLAVAEDNGELAEDTIEVEPETVAKPKAKAKAKGK